MSTNSTAGHKNVKYLKALSNDDKGTDTEQKGLRTPTYPEREGVEKFSHLLHITTTVHCPQKKKERYNMKSLVALLKVESSFYLQEAAPDGETSLGNVWWLYWLVPTPRVGSNVDVSRLSRP